MMRIFNKKIISFLLTLSFVVPVSLLSYPQKSEATLPVIDAGNIVQNTISALSNAASKIYNYSTWYKENVLDGIAWYIAKAIIRQMTTSIVNWINSGFDGNPSFVTDPAGMFINIADQELGKFIAGSSDLNFLCSPFSIDVRISLAFRYRPFKQKVTCTFSDVIKNATGAKDSFMKGNFVNGGWNKWISLTTEPQNNYIGASLLADEELSIRIANKSANQKMELDWGKGFLSWKKCVAYASNDPTSSNFVGPRNQGTNEGEAGFTGPLNEAPPSATGNGGLCSREETQTPGTVIESGLENVLGSGVRQLELADEFNEIINALFAQLVKTVITSAAGLKGTSGGGSFDSNSYINKMQSQQDAEDKAALINIQNNSIKGLTDSITEETTYNQNKNASLAVVLQTKDKFTSAKTCYEQKINTPQTPPLKSGEITVAQNRIAQIGDIITTSINPISGPLSADAAASTNLLIELNGYKNAILNAKTVNDTVDPSNKYQSLLQNQKLHDTAMIVRSGTEKDDVTANMATLGAQADVQVNQCRTFPAGATY